MVDVDFSPRTPEAMQYRDGDLYVFVRTISHPVSRYTHETFPPR